MALLIIPRIVLSLAAMLFLGYFILWCFVPTGFWWYGWFVFLSIKTNTKYFGLQGSFMLIFTVPVIIIAVLGCVYLHLMKNHARGHPINSLKSAVVKGSDEVVGAGIVMRKPTIVRGPLGVLSATEIVFLLFFITLLIWSIAYINTHIPIVQNMNPRQTRRHVNDTIWQKKLRTTGFYMATSGNLCTALLFYPVTRGSSILPLVGLTPDGTIKYHMWLGNLAMFFFTTHGATFILYWALTNDLVEMLKWDMHSVANVPGEIAALLGVAMWVTVHPRVRRKTFELFFYTHHLYIPFMFFYMLHTGFAFFCMILPGFYLFLVDRCLRFLQSRRKVRLLSARILPCQTVELNFSKSPTLHYTPTSFVSINVPSISSMQWHPFSVSSSSSLEPDVLSVIIKEKGNWSQKLYETLTSLSPVDRLEVAIQGPYGPASADFLRYKTMVMVAGGSGISPIISIIREIIFRDQGSRCSYVGSPGRRRRSINYNIPHIILICAFKQPEDLTMLNLILPNLNNGGKGQRLIISQLIIDHIQIEAFVTARSVDNIDAVAAAAADHHHKYITNYNHVIKTIWFRGGGGGREGGGGDDEDREPPGPLSPTLGPHAWFWLGSIIFASFAMFLLITGLLGRYYFYPKDKNSNMVYSWTARTCLNALSLCVSIITTATTVVAWNKRRSSSYANYEAADGKRVVMPMSTNVSPNYAQVQIMSSSSSNADVQAHHHRHHRYYVDQELESRLPAENHQTIIQNTRVHYGSRPNLKKMLLEYDEPGTGVLVCGPASMRQEVAKICASGLADNLHYESISFSF